MCARARGLINVTLLGDTREVFPQGEEQRARGRGSRRFFFSEKLDFNWMNSKTNNTSLCVVVNSLSLSLSKSATYTHKNKGKNLTNLSVYSIARRLSR
jgi:hypothetical protein